MACRMASVGVHMTLDIPFESESLQLHDGTTLIKLGPPEHFLCPDTLEP